MQSSLQWIPLWLDKECLCGVEQKPQDRHIWLVSKIQYNIVRTTPKSSFFPRQVQEFPPSSPPLTSIHHDKSSNTCPSSTRYTRYLRLHSNSRPNSKSKKVMLLSYTSVLWIECTGYNKQRIQDCESRKKIQANPRSRVVHLVSYMFPTECVWTMSQRCPTWWALVIRIIGYQLTQIHTHSAKPRTIHRNPR